MKITRQFQLWTGIYIDSIKKQFFTPGRYYALKRDLKRFKSQCAETDEYFPVTKLYPCFADKHASAGGGGDYFFQDLWVAQRIFHNQPVRHIDIGSRIDGFVAHVASFRPIEIFDIRPLDLNMPNISFYQCDLMCESKIEEEITDSISCLHALEHFGLGRYGDPICYNGYLKGFENITRMLKPKGKCYFSVPMGRQRVEFHAHRVFSLKYLVSMVATHYEIDQFSYVDDAGNFYKNVALTQQFMDAPPENNSNWYGLAIFELSKK